MPGVKLPFKKLEPSDSYAWKEATAQPVLSLRPNNVEPTDVHVDAPLPPVPAVPKAACALFAFQVLMRGESRRVSKFSVGRYAAVHS